MAIKVKLRFKVISQGRESLYLDFYPAIKNLKTGKLTRREFLGMYVFIDKTKLKKEIEAKKKVNAYIDDLVDLHKELKSLTAIEKKHNEEVIKIGESVRQQRENFLNKPEIYNEYEKEQLRLKELKNKCFVEYFEKLANKRKKSNHNNWISALKYFKSYTKGSITFGELNESVFEDFKEYLLNTKSNKSSKTKLSTNSAVSYFNKVKATLRQAFKDGLLQTDINAQIASIKLEETRREFLTLEELNRLVKTPCNNDLLKRAALFSAMTGLRFSDIQKMTWSELEYIKGQGWFLNFSQKKTKGIESLPISEQAYSLLGELKEAKTKVFEGLEYSAYNNKHLFQWIGAAGITKEITFHCFRHTYATLQLFNGTDLYTVSKMLGHKDLKTTQIYAKIVDEAKRETTNKIKLDM